MVIVKVAISISCWVMAVSRVLLSGAKPHPVDVDIFPMGLLRVSGVSPWHLGLVGCGRQQLPPPHTHTHAATAGIRLTELLVGGMEEKKFLLASQGCTDFRVYWAQLMCS